MRASESRRRAWSLTPVLVTWSVLSSLANAADRWAKVIGGTGEDYLNTIQRTSDSGYIVAGNTYSFPIGGSGDVDGCLIKLSSAGGVEWQRVYGGTAGDNFNSVREVPGGGVVAVGQSYSFGGGGLDVWVVRVDRAGTLIWSMAYGKNADELGYSIEPTPDGGFILAGITSSAGAGGKDVLLMKLDQWGNVIWQKTYGKAGDDYPFDVAATPDGYVMVGTSNSVFWPGDALVLKVDLSGNEIWNQRFVGTQPQGSSFAALLSINLAANGSLLVGGRIEATGSGDSNGWVLSLDPASGFPNGGPQILSGSGWDEIRDVQQSADGNYVAAGFTTSFGGGYYDAWVVTLDSSPWMNLLSGSTYGGAYGDWVTSVCLASDGDFVFAGTAGGFGAGGADGFLLKAEPTGRADPACSLGRPWIPATDDTWGGNGLFSFTSTNPNLTTYAISNVISTTPDTSQMRTLCATGPTITLIKSKTSKPGSAATIYGTGFSATSKKNTVYFDTKKAKISKAKTTSLKVTIPKKVPKGTVQVWVVVDGRWSSPYPFVIN